MGNTARAAGGVVEFTGIGFHVGNEVPQVAHRHRFADGHHERVRAHNAHRNKVFFGLVIGFADRWQNGQHRHGRHQEGVAVSWRLGDKVRRNGAQNDQLSCQGPTRRKAERENVF